MTGGATLAARQVGVQFEGVRALEAVDLTLAQGQILGLIGPNGAGKTTLVNVLSGFQKPSEGGVTLAGQDTSSWAPHLFARRGLARTFQAARLFPALSVLENAEMAGVGLGASRAAARADAMRLLGLMGIAHRAEVRADALSYGEERLVGIARALVLKPTFLLLDEPAAGLSPQEALDLMQRIAMIRREIGCGILVIEHNIQLIMRLCDSVQVLARGRSIALGTPAEVQRSAVVRDAYLGATDDTGIAARGRPAPAHGPDLLALRDLIVDYGSVRALYGVTLSVRQGEFVSVIGPNGAGKSTLLAAVTGLVKPKSGSIAYDGAALPPGAPSRRVEMGIALVPEGRRILSNLTVEENLRVGEMTKRRDPAAPARFAEVLDRFPVLRARLKGYAGLLSGGEQQQLAIARALLSGPRLLLLDEPSLGLAPMMIEQVYQTLADLNALGLTILLMEQNANRALLAADRAYVLRHGLIELEGGAEALRRDPAFDRAYFGFDAPEGVPTH